MDNETDLIYPESTAPKSTAIGKIKTVLCKAFSYILIRYRNREHWRNCGSDRNTDYCDHGAPVFPRSYFIHTGTKKRKCRRFMKTILI